MARQRYVVTRVFIQGNKYSFITNVLVGIGGGDSLSGLSLHGRFVAVDGRVFFFAPADITLCWPDHPALLLGAEVPGT